MNDMYGIICFMVVLILIYLQLYVIEYKNMIIGYIGNIDAEKLKALALTIIFMFCVVIIGLILELSRQQYIINKFIQFIINKI